jgi:MFS family permease
MDQSYGILQGMAYTIPFSLCGVILGLMKNGYNRKRLLSGIVIVAGLSQFISGAVTSFPLLCVMRAFHGACFSLTIPLLSSMLRDYFPQERRGTANSILYSANYFGTALSSMGVMAISQFGWRATYGIMGGFGVLIGLLSSIFVREPQVEDSPPKAA